MYNTLCATLLWKVMIMVIYNTILTSEYSSQYEDNIHPHKQGQKKQTTLSAAQ